MGDCRRCPICDSKSIATQVWFRSKIDAPVRYRKCRYCHYRWQTVEIDREEYEELLNVYTRSNK